MRLTFRGIMLAVGGALFMFSPPIGDSDGRAQELFGLVLFGVGAAMVVVAKVGEWRSNR